MNNYQIYEEIGKGRNSTVYKGRRKRSIEYYAVASIDKGIRPRVLNSVQFLRQLDHPNVLKFHAWYETNNHLWVITEYCTGGSLKQLLELETSLPEKSTRTFGADLAEGLHFMHSRGILYGDVKPSNVLMDDCAVLRFYDFGLSVAVADAEGCSSKKVGSPAYMAPELLMEGGVHSYASDLWALGCTLYEMTMGRPPFVHAQLQDLIHAVVHEPTPRAEGYGDAFNELIDGLLQKNPLLRATWSDVLQSDFWGGRQLEARDLPTQPAFEAFREKRLADKTKKLGDGAEATRRQLLRASVNAERNIARELKTRGGYGEAAAASLATDREVDFTEAASSDHGGDAGGSGEEVNSALGGVDTAAAKKVNDADANAAAQEAATKSPAQISNTAAVTAASAAPASARGPSATRDTGAVGGVVAVGAAGGRKGAAHFLSGVPPCCNIMAHSSDTQVKPLIMNNRIEKIAEPTFDPKELAFPVRTVEQLKEMDDKRLDQFLEDVYNALGGSSTLADKQNTLAYFASLAGNQQRLANVFVNSTVATLCVKILSLEKMTIIACAQLATVLGLLVRYATIILPEFQKSGVFEVLAKAAARDKMPKLRRRALGCLGELLFFVVTQAPAIKAEWSIHRDALEAIIGALDDPDDVARHYAVKVVENVAVATNIEAWRRASAPEAGGDDSGSGRDSVAARFAAEDVCRLLLGTFTAPVAEVKSEHMRASALVAALRLCQLDEALAPVVLDLLPIAVYGDVLAAHSSRATQALLTFVNFLLARRVSQLFDDATTGADALVRQVQWMPGDGEQGGSASTAGHAERLFFTDPVPQVLAARLATFAAALAADDGTLLNGLACCLEHTSSAVRGKAVIAMTLLASCEPAFVTGALRIFPDRLSRDKDEYVRHALQQWLRLIRAYVKSVVASASVGDGEGATALPVVLEIIGFASLRAAVVEDGGALFSGIAAGIRAISAQTTSAAQTEKPSTPAATGSEAPTPTSTSHPSSPALSAYLQLCALLTKESDAVAAHHETVADDLLPALLCVVRSKDPGVRYEATPLIHDVLATLLNDSAVYNPSRSNSRGVQALNRFASALVPELPGLLTARHPTPLYALKLINLLCDRGTSLVAQLATPAVVDILLASFSRGHVNNTGFTAKALLRTLQAGGDALVAHAVECGLVGRVTDILEQLVEAVPGLDAAGANSADGSTMGGAGETALEAYGEPCAELMLTVLFSARREPRGAAATAAAEWAVGLDRLILPLCTVRAACSECAAACAPLLTSLFPDKHTLLTATGRAHLRAALAGGDDAALHVGAPLAQALAAALQGPDAATAAAALRGDELLLALLQQAAASAAAGGDAERQGGEALARAEAAQEALEALGNAPAP